MRGFADKKIAEDLRISEETVNFHIRKVFQKFGVHNRVEAAILYLKVKGKQLTLDELRERVATH